MANIIQGSGGGKGKGGGGAWEAPNTLQTFTKVRVIEAISEGEIEGIEGGAEGVYLNDVPLINSDGSKNFEFAEFDFRAGMADQSRMAGFPTDEAEFMVNTLVTLAAPAEYITTTTDIDALRVTIGMPDGLVFQDPKKGNLLQHSVRFALDVNVNNGPWSELSQPKIEGKTTSPYERQYLVRRPASAPSGQVWGIRIRRISTEHDKAIYRDRISLARVTEIIESNETYNHTAVIGLAVDAASVGNQIPKRSYLINGRIVRVPVNFDPVARTFTGVWNGEFKYAWTNDPAWVLLDVLTNTRFGLGNQITDSDIDLYSLYDASVYNSEFINDGKGGSEPRYSFNAVIMAQDDPIKLCQYIAGTFRSTLVQVGKLFAVSQDRPRSIARVITSANVIGGKFDYSGTDLQQRHTVVNVTWQNPAQQYRPDVVTVEADESALIRYGWNQTDVTAFACTSEGQATRFGKWFLETQLNQAEMVQFQMSFNGFNLQLGDVVNIWDREYTALDTSGRILNVVRTGTTALITLDREIDIKPSSVFSFGQNGVKSYDINSTGLNTVIEVELGADASPAIRDVFVISDIVQARPFEITALSQPEMNVVQVTAVAHDPGKYARIESGIVVDTPSYSEIDVSRVRAPSNFTAEMSAFRTDAGIKRELIVSWTPNDERTTFYSFSYRLGDGQWISKNTQSVSETIPLDVEGEYTFRINAYGLNGSISTALTGAYSFLLTGGTGSALIAPTALQVKTGGNTFLDGDCAFQWINPIGNEDISAVKDFEIRILNAFDEVIFTDHAEAVDAGEAGQYVFTLAQNRFVTGNNPLRSFKVQVFARDFLNKLSTPAQQVFSNPMPVAPTVTLTAGVKSVAIDVSTSNESDAIGVRIWGSNTSGFTPSDANLLYEGSSPFYIWEGIEQTAYIRAAWFDSFGKTGLNLSTQVASTPTSAGGVPSVSTLPANPAAIDGENVVYLDSGVAATRGLYAWNGTAWAYTRDGANLIANSVTADKITVATLGAISANLGTINSGNVTIDSASWIRTSGASAYGTGTGIWMGYHLGAYKWRVGTPGSSGAEWDGTSFKIFDASGNVTISSGAPVSVNWANIAARPTDAQILNNDSSNNVTFIKLPVGGSYGVLTGSVTGALKITLPQTWSSTMIRFIVEIYEYAANRSCTYELGGYNLSSGEWRITYAKMVGAPSAQKTVRFGHDGSKCCVYIGEINTLWTHPQVRVVDVVVGYSNRSIDQWATGWAVGMESTAFGPVTSTITNPVPGGAISGVDQITPSNASTYIANAAIQTAQIADASIVNAKIADLSVTGAKIQDASIGTAKIADLSVTTLKIGEEQIVVNRYASVALTPIAFANSYKWYAILTAAPVTIQRGGISILTHNVGVINNGGGAGRLATRIVRITGGTTTVIWAGPVWDQVNSFVPTMIFDSPGAGTHQYQVQVFLNDYATTASIAPGHMLIQGAQA